MHLDLFIPGVHLTGVRGRQQVVRKALITFAIDLLQTGTLLHSWNSADQSQQSRIIITEHLIRSARCFPSQSLRSA